MGNDQSQQTSLLGSDYAISRSSCRIVVVGRKSGDGCLLALANLPPNARIVATGNNIEEIKKDGDLYSEVLCFYVTNLKFVLNNSIFMIREMLYLMLVEMLRHWEPLLTKCHF